MTRRISINDKNIHDLLVEGHIKLATYTFRGGNTVKMVPPFWKGATVHGKNLLPQGANSYLVK